MKKTLHFKFAVLALALVTLAGTPSIAQKKAISITSTVQIAATKSEVFDVLKQLKRFPEWSPFIVTDPNQKYTIGGTNGEIGSSYSWVGVAEKSKGTQTLAKMEENQYIRMECMMEKPFEGQPVFEYHLKETQSGIEVVQDFNLKLSRFSYFMTKMFGVKKKMTASNQLGLARLKALVEKETSLTVKN